MLNNEYISKTNQNETEPRLVPQSALHIEPLTGLCLVGGPSAPVSPTRAASAPGATLAAMANSSPWRSWTRAWVFHCSSLLFFLNNLQYIGWNVILTCSTSFTKFVCVFFQGEIRVTGFNQEVDKFFSLIEVGKVRRSSRWWFSTSWLSAKTVFHCPVKGGFGCRPL